jgi:CBS domain containing-hemolysin-like protein
MLMEDSLLSRFDFRMTGWAPLLAAEGDWGTDLLKILAIPALVLLNAFFVAAEFALVAVRRTQIEEMIRQGRRGAQSLRKQVEHLDHAIAATQLGITIASIALGWVSETALAPRIKELFTFLAGGWQTAVAHALATAVAFVLVMFLHVILGELAPKAMALQRPAGVALWVAIPLDVFTKLTRPIVMLMNGVGNRVVRLLGFRAIPGEQMVHSVEELSMLVEEVEEAGLLSADQAEFVYNVFELANKTVGDCMVPREEMATLELHTPPDKVLEAVRQGAHTRMPVYEGDIHNIVGIVNTKDLFYLFSLQGVVVLHDAIYPALFLKPDQPIADALRLFRRARRPMAVVRNDAGQVVGMITLEDVLEEIVGDIEDEHDRPIRKVRPKVVHPARRLPTPRN